MTQELLLTGLAAIFTIISPVVIQWRKTSDWSQTLRVALPVVVSLAISIVYLIATNALHGLNVLAAFLMVYGLHQLVYGAIVKHLQALRDAPDGRYEAGRAEDLAPIPGTTLDLGAVESLPHEADTTHEM